MTFSQKQLVIALEWILFIGLSSVSVWFTSGVFENFFSGRSSFSQYEEAVRTYPVIVIELKKLYQPISSTDVEIFYR